MKASKPFIEMLTQGRADYEEIGSFLGVPVSTARSICNGNSFRHETAVKITRAFPDVSPRQLFRNPVRPFELREQLLRDERLRGNEELSSETQQRIAMKVWKITHRNRVKAQKRIYVRRWRARVQIRQSENSRTVAQRLERYGLVSKAAA